MSPHHEHILLTLFTKPQSPEGPAVVTWCTLSSAMLLTKDQRQSHPFCLLQEVNCQAAQSNQRPCPRSLKVWLCCTWNWQQQLRRCCAQPAIWVLSEAGLPSTLSEKPEGPSSTYKPQYSFMSETVTYFSYLLKIINQSIIYLFIHPSIHLMCVCVLLNTYMCTMYV